MDRSIVLIIDGYPAADLSSRYSYGAVAEPYQSQSECSASAAWSQRVVRARNRSSSAPVLELASGVAGTTESDSAAEEAASQQTAA